MKTIKSIKNDFNNADILKLYSDCMYRPTQEKLRKRANDYMSNNLITIYGLYVESQIAGVIVIEQLQGKLAEIRGVAVKSEYRKRGLGKRLIQHVFETLSIMELLAETDDDAVDFYKNCGFYIERFQKQSENGEYIRYKCTLSRNSLHFK